MKQITPTRQASGGGSRILNAFVAQRAAERASRSPAGLWHAAPDQVKLLKAPPTAGLRRFMAASNDRLVSDMMDTLGIVSGNAEVRQSLRSMRAKSRRLAKDNEYVKYFLHLLRNNVPGPKGFTLQMKIYKQRGGKLDSDANATIEEAYAEHSKRGNFTPCGRASRGTFERSCISNLARDGEVIIERLFGACFGRFGIAHQLIDPDLLDDSLNLAVGSAMPGYGKLDTGNSIRMGVEVDQYMKPVAYWFLSLHPGDDVAGYAVMRHRRVDADRIIHWFLSDDARPGVTRGVPLIYSGLRRMAMLGGYEEAALVNARQGASKMGFYKPPAQEMGAPPDGSEVADGQEDNGTPSGGDLYQEAEPGVFGVLPAGWDFQTYDPAYPNDAMGGFIKAMLRAFSSSVGISYPIIGNDYADINLSTIRYSALQDRDTFESLQEAMIEAISLPIFESWLSLSLGLGQVGRLPPDGYDRFNKPRFFPRKWRSPDPQKDLAAGAQAVALGVTSRTRLCAENGDDFEEILEELSREEQMARDKKVTLNTNAAMASKNPPKTPPGPQPASEDGGTATGLKPDDEGETDATSTDTD